MLEIRDKGNCTGCAACACSCPKHCITMKEDDEGFLYPSVNAEACVNCHICERVCPVLSAYVEGKQPEDKIVYALIHNDAQVRKCSASGGAFALFAEQVLSVGGVVYGAAFAQGFQTIQHIRIDSIEELPMLQGSKYVQSDMNYVFQQVRQDLLEGRRVLFSGTPCQNAGLRSYLGKDYDDLLCIEFICHGVPSPKIWRMYLNLIRKKLGGDIKRVLFREKPECENPGGG